ncbi:cannabinoid receptor 2 isoform 2-T2 [Syngnathus typhle]
MSNKIESPVILTCIVLEYGKKTEYPVFRKRRPLICVGVGKVVLVGAHEALQNRRAKMEELENPSLVLTQVKENPSASTVNRSCENLEFYMVLIAAEKTAIGSICFLAGPITLLENAVILGLIAATSSLRQRPSYIFIGNLALADVFASCFFTTSFLDFHLFRRCDGPTAYLFKLGGVTMAFTNSVGSLLLTALDRYLCIHRPAGYKALLTRRRALLGLLALWSATVFISTLPLMGWTCPTGLASPCSHLFPYISRGYLACWTSFILVLLVLILGAYVLILWKAHRHEASLSNLQGAVGAGHARMRMDIRLARTFGLILLTLVGCWLPALSFMLADVAVELSRTQQRAFAFCSTLCLLNSAVNPLLYALRCRELRLALLHQVKVLSQAARCKKATAGDSDQRAPSMQNCTTQELPGNSQFCSVLELTDKQ